MLHSSHMCSVIYEDFRYYSSLLLCVFFFKQKTSYEMRISDWSSDVCSSDLLNERDIHIHPQLFKIGITAIRFHVAITEDFPMIVPNAVEDFDQRSEERRVGKSVSVRVDLGGRGIIKKKKIAINEDT